MPIKSQAEYDAALQEIERFFRENPEPGTEEADRFVELLKEIEAFEEEHFPNGDADPVLIFEVGGIKCDNEACDYSDDTVTVEDYPAWVNRPCPKCGENLLTEADYDHVQKMIAYTETMNAIAAVGGLSYERITDPDADDVNITEFDLDGSGMLRPKG